jgi:hypothetical protein
MHISERTNWTCIAAAFSLVLAVSISRATREKVAPSRLRTSSPNHTGCSRASPHFIPIFPCQESCFNIIVQYSVPGSIPRKHLHTQSPASCPSHVPLRTPSPFSFANQSIPPIISDVTCLLIFPPHSTKPSTSSLFSTNPLSLRPRALSTSSNELPSQTKPLPPTTGPLMPQPQPAARRHHPNAVAANSSSM